MPPLFETVANFEDVEDEVGPDSSTEDVEHGMDDTAAPVVGDTGTTQNVVAHQPPISARSVLLQPFEVMEFVTPERIVDTLMQYPDYDFRA